MRIFALLVVLVIASSSYAQEPSSPTDASETAETASTESEEAAALLEAALAAKARGDYDRALAALEQAYRVQPSPLFIYHRILVLEAMGEPTFAADLLTQHRDALMATDGVDDLFVVEQRLKHAVETPLETPEPTSPATSRSTFDTVGPILLGLTGLGLGGWSTYIWTASCGVEASNGNCLQGPTPNTALGVISAGGAVGALVGAVVWWFMAAPEPDSRVNLTPTSNGFMVRF